MKILELLFPVYFTIKQINEQADQRETFDNAWKVAQTSNEHLIKGDNPVN